MDEITDVRICPLDRADHWGIRYQFKSGDVRVDEIGALADAVTAASRLRRPPTLTVIEGSRSTRPDPTTTGVPHERRVLVVVK